MTDRQAQTGSLDLGFGGVERLKEQIHLLGLNTDTGVLDRHCNSFPFLPGAYGDHPAGLDAGIRRIGQQIKKDLFDLVRNRQDLRQPFGIVEFHAKSVCS